MTCTPALVVSLTLLAASPLAGQASDSTLVRAAQRVLVSTLDSTGPRRPLDQWLAQLGGVPPASLRWEVNDCGEGGDGRAAPTCVEGQLVLAPDTMAVVSVIVAGLTGVPAAPPDLWMLYLQEGTRITTATRIRDLEALVRGRR